MTLREQTQRREDSFLSPHACRSAQSRGRQRTEEECSVRTPFQLDIDRIVYSKAFRRLKHKTQVFLQPEGDHYRTRMTHTLEVSRIARTISRALTLNEDLTEAIALGHDLGHTPFGHAGERALNSLMPGGFAHYQQSVRVVERLEKNGEGLNLTWEVRNGILCHTKGQDAATLEGQVVRLADHIAYINHDIEDALRGGIIYPMDIPLEISRVLGFTHTERINCLVMDVIQASQGQEQIAQSEKIGSAMRELREFMFANVYLHPRKTIEEQRLEKVIDFFFSYYQEHAECLPEEYRHSPLKRAVCDYIAGMTDTFALHHFADLSGCTYTPAI